MSANILNLFPTSSPLSIVTVLSYQSIAAELYAAHNQAVDESAVLAAHCTTCAHVFEDVKAAGFTAITVAVSDKEKLGTNPVVRER